MVSTVLSQEQQEELLPDEDLMFERRGFDRRTLRDELAGRTAIDSQTKFVEQGQARYVHPQSDMPEGPTSVGEVLGNVQIVQETGSQVRIPRWTHGFTYQIEDGEVDGGLDLLQEYRDSIAELFDLQADVSFFNGLDDEAGNTVYEGVFEWLQNNVDTSQQVIDCSNFDPSSGDLGGVAANIILKEAYSRIEGRYVETSWDVAVAKHPVWAEWNGKDTFDGAVVDSEWEMVETENTDDVGVNRRMLLPDTIGLRAPADLDRNLEFDITFPTRENTGFSSDLGTSDYPDYTADDDVMWLIPEHNGDFYELYEQRAPDQRGPISQEGFRERVEYKWRGGVVQGLSYRTDGNAVDAIKLENVTALFDNS